MKFLLAAVNAKYIHSNLGVYSLKKYADEKRKQQGTAFSGPDWEIEIGEYTINHQMDYILQDIYEKAPDAVGFSCYIWNILYVQELIRDLKKVLPQTEIWLGGPEVSYRAEEFLRKEPSARGVMAGEGEETFFRLLGAAKRQDAGSSVWRDEALEQIPGLVFRREAGSGSSSGPETGEIVKNPPAPLMDLDDIPFVYSDLKGMENRIIYYESSRGCPFSCSYCLSSIDKTVRFRSLDRVKRELAFFLENRVPQVKFVDRTFNCKKSHSMEIWRFIQEHDNGITNFHFEISADLLSEEELSLLSQMRPGLVQLEIGVQTTNPDTIREIRRRMDLGKLESHVRQINGFGNIHQHLDLIAGLPWEGYESFKRSFNQVYAMEPEQLQLGFLKVLSGSYMEERAQDYGLRFRDTPPYEVLATRWLSYGELIRLKGVEEMVEIYYNSGQFRNTVKELQKEFLSPFDMYESLREYYREKGLSAVSHSRNARYEILFAFIEKTLGKRPQTGVQTSAQTEGQTEEQAEDRTEEPADRLELYRDLLTEDLYLRENAKSRPSFARDLSPFKEEIKQFFIREGKEPCRLTGYEGYDSRQMSRMAHMEVMRDGRMLLFDYLCRDALLGNARTIEAGKIRGDNETAEPGERRKQKIIYHFYEKGEQ
ncbi:MAG: B12-binding domain-containing radical SAM protein [Clostridium sp.]|nr:B12-binding domain-containing radical SAM protein [Clostridium sp.]